MGTKSTAVKRIERYEIAHLGGVHTKVLRILFVDPADPETLIVHEIVWLLKPLEFITLDLEL